jgi:hypothetical protein
MKKTIMMTAATMVLGTVGCFGATVADMTGTSFSSNQQGTPSSSAQPTPLVVMAGAAGLVGLLVGKRKKAQ